MTEETTETSQCYEMVSIRRSEPPPGAEGSNWHRYVIAFAGRNNIRGCRQGSLNVVTGAVEDIVTQLNERHRGKYGRAHVVPTPKKAPTA
jgi:hypothetical protein